MRETVGSNSLTGWIDRRTNISGVCWKSALQVEKMRNKIIRNSVDTLYQLIKADIKKATKMNVYNEKRKRPVCACVRVEISHETFMNHRHHRCGDYKWKHLFRQFHKMHKSNEDNLIQSAACLMYVHGSLFCWTRQMCKCTRKNDNTWRKWFTTECGPFNNTSHFPLL